MFCKSLSLHAFRNLQEQHLEFVDGVNIFMGRNAQGKTNMIEALWLFSGCKSFRPGNDRDFIQFGMDGGVIRNEYEKNGRVIESEIRFHREKRREIYRNGAKIKLGELIGGFNSVLFFPEHLALIKSGPEERRKFLDFAISQVKPRYFSLTNEYMKVLAQRNYLLKSGHGDIYQTIDIWDRKLAHISSIIAVTRKSYLEKLNRYSEKIMDDISNGKEKIELSLLSYTGAESVEKAEEACYGKLKENFHEDLRSGFTSVGSHRDDIGIAVNGLAARTYCSQGQQRSCVMAMKLGEAEILHEMVDEYPVMLFDDVFSELDSIRKEYLTEKIKNKQVFITTCEEQKTVSNARIFHVESGGAVF